MKYIFHNPKSITGKEWFKQSSILSFGVSAIISAAMSILAIVDDPSMSPAHVVTAFLPFVFIISMVILTVMWFRCVRHNRAPDKLFGALEKYAYNLAIFGLIGMVMGLLLPGIVLIALCAIIVSVYCLFGRFPFRARYKLKSDDLTILSLPQLTKAAKFANIVGVGNDHNAEVRQRLRLEIDSRMKRSPAE